MKKIINTLLITFTLGFSMSSHAAEWSGWYPISQVYTHTNGNVYIVLKPGTGHPNPENCASTHYLTTPANSLNVKDIYQMALTAQASGMKVSAYVSGCSGTYPKVIHLRSISN